MSAPTAFICDALRTPFGRYGGALSALRTDDLAAWPIQALMARHGLGPERVVMRNSSNIFKGLHDFDILLDCFPHSGGTMLVDALWMGVPVLTLAARPPLGRIGTTFMTNIGLPQWVAHDEQEYIEKAWAYAKAKGFESPAAQERMRDVPRRRC